MTIIKGSLARIYTCDNVAASTTFTTEAMTEVAGASDLTATITDSTKRFWDPTATTTVYYNGSPVTSYTEIRYPVGQVYWATSPGGNQVTVTGKYFAVTELTQCRSWELSIDAAMVDVTCLGDTGRVNMPTVRDATVTVEGFYLDSTREDRIIDSRIVGLDLFLDKTAASEKRFGCWARPSGDTISSAVDGAIGETMSFDVFLGPYYVAGL